MRTLLLTHLAALVLFFLAPRFWAAKDAHAFSVNPADDTFHDTFHRQRLSWRVAFLLVVAALASEAAWPAAWATACSFAGLATIGSAYFFFDFNPRLNTARGLDYVGRYYVSFDPQAARFPDRWLADRARKVERYDASLQRAWAALELQKLLRLVLETGAALYLVLLVLTYFLL